MKRSASRRNENFFACGRIYELNEMRKVKELRILDNLMKMLLMLSRDWKERGILFHLVILCH